MATGYYILSGVTVAAGATTLSATGIAEPGGTAQPVNFLNLVGGAGAEGTPAGHLLLAPGGAATPVQHATSATTLALGRGWQGGAVTNGTVIIVLGINALPIGRLATLITQIAMLRPLLKTNNLAEFAGDGTAQAEVRQNIGVTDLLAAIAAAVEDLDSDKQDALGFSPVEQGGGVGQLANKIHIGWSAERLRAQVDTTDLGEVWTDYSMGAVAPAKRAALGITPAGDALAVAASVAAQRTALGQKWVTIFDQTVIGGPIYGFDVPLLGFDLFKITLRTLANTAMADSALIWLGSSDGGASFAQGASDYRTSYLHQAGTDVLGGPHFSGTYGQLTGTIDTTYGSITHLINAEFSRGAFGEARMSALTSGFDGAFYSQDWLTSTTSALGTAMNLLRIASLEVAIFAPGSRLIVEAC